MTFEEATHYLFSSFPSFEKSGKTGINEGLQITRDFLNTLGNPHHSVRCIHIAGTNGKGSSSHFIASILQEAGYKTGLFTSPHIRSFTERIKINGKEISEQRVIDFIVENKDTLDQLKPSFFEITTVMAFQYFSEQKVDIAILETGLGGRLDSSNVIEKPIVALITNIGLDHTEMLGNDLASIAKEKAGIIKPDRPIVQSESDPAYNVVIRETALSKNAPLVVAADSWESEYLGWENGSGYFRLKNIVDGTTYTVQSALAGGYQKYNLAGVIETCKVLSEQGYTITNDNIISGIEHVVTNTQMKGRWQTLSEEPFILCDAVHNVSGWHQVLYQLNQMPIPCSVMVLGFSNDKKPEQFIDKIPVDTKVIFSKFENKRSTDPQLLKAYADCKGLECYVANNVNEAVERSKEIVKPGSFIFVGGSIYLLSELNNI